MSLMYKSDQFIAFEVFGKWFVTPEEMNRWPLRVFCQGEINMLYFIAWTKWDFSRYIVNEFDIQVVGIQNKVRML